METVEEHIETQAVAGETAGAVAGAAGEKAGAAETHASTAFSPPTIASETVFHVGGFGVRNTLLMSWIAVAFLVIVAWRYFKSSSNVVPVSRFQVLIETVVEGLYSFFHSVTQDEKQTRQFFTLCATIFIYVIISNWFGILPGVGPIGLWEAEEGHQILVPLFRSTYSDVNMTLAIAVISIVSVQFYGMKNLGIFSYLGKFFVNPFKDFIGCFVGILEIVSEIAKIVSFSFRLYGNIFAGEVLLAVMGFLMPFIAPLPFFGLELFVGLIQGLVFALLSLVFLKMGSTGHGDHGDEHAPHGVDASHAVTAS